MDDEEMLRLVTAVSEVQAVVPDAPLGAASAAVRKFGFDTARAIAYLLDNGGSYPDAGTGSVGPGGKLREEPKPQARPPPPQSKPTLQSSGKRDIDPIDAVVLPPEYEDLSESVERAVKTMLYEEQQAKLRAVQAEEALTKQFLAEESRQAQAALDGKTYSCSICMDELKIDAIYILEECEHKFCRVCLGEHCQSQINDGNTRHIRCPFNKCKHVISYIEIKQLVDDATMTKYEKFLLRAALEDDPNCCWCPRPGCQMAMIANGGLMLVCPNDKCRYTFCRQCKEEWHADATCEQYKQWKIDNGQADAKFTEWAKANTKECPKCKKRIEKNGGCNHMTCTQCKYEFCWLCMGAYKSGHFGDKSKCQQFT